MLYAANVSDKQERQGHWYMHWVHVTINTYTYQCPTLSLSLGPLLLTWFNFNPSNYIHFKVWDEVIYPSLNFNGATVEV